VRFIQIFEAPIGNRGDASEIYQAIALYLLFKNKTVSGKDIQTFVMKTVAAKSPNINIQSRPNQKGDVFKLQMPIPASVKTTLFDLKNYQQGGLYADMPDKVAQATSNEYNKQVQFIHDNQRKDAIDIAVVGGKGGKVDVMGTVTYTDAQGKQKTEPLENMEISLKIGSDKFGQLSGKQMVAAFGNAFGINADSIAKQTGFSQALAKANPLMLQITPTKIKKQKTISRDDADKILAQIETMLYGKGDGPMHKFYRAVANTINTQLTGPQGEKKERKIIANALGNLVKSGIGKVTMLNYEKNGYSILDQTAIKKLSDLMKTTDLRVEYAIKGKKQDDVSRPYIEFYDTKDNEMFFFVRNNMDHYGVIRNNLQQGKKFAQFKRFVKYNK